LSTILSEKDIYHSSPIRTFKFGVPYKFLKSTLLSLFSGSMLYKWDFLAQTNTPQQNRLLFVRKRFQYRLSSNSTGLHLWTTHVFMHERESHKGLKSKKMPGLGFGRNTLIRLSPKKHLFLLHYIMPVNPPVPGG